MTNGSKPVTDGVSNHPLLFTRDLCLQIGGQGIVEHINCGFAAGTLTAIVGPNGAGKTSFFNLLSGQIQASSGQVYFAGVDITGYPVPRRTRLGMARAFQINQLFADITVIKNVYLALLGKRSRLVNLFSLLQRDQRLHDEAMYYLQQVGLQDYADLPVSALSHGNKRKLEIAILMALDPRVLLFDEPTSGVGVDDVPVILDLIQNLKQQGDKLILLIEHKIEAIRALSDRIVVLNQGAVIADGLPQDVMSSAIVQQAYFGDLGVE